MDLAVLVNNKNSFPNIVDSIDGDSSPDDLFDQIVEGLRTKYDLPGSDPFSLEQNLSDVAIYIGRLLSLRRDIATQQAERVRLALSYLTVIETAEADFELEVARCAGDANIVKAADKKLQVIKLAVKRLDERHCEAGGALNYRERIAKYLAEFSLDVRSLVWKSDSISKGVQSFGYTVKYPLPVVNSIQYASFQGARTLDDFSAWARLVMEDVESQQITETICEVSLCLGSPTLRERLVGDIPTDHVAEPVHAHIIFAKESFEKIIVPNLLDRIKNSFDINFKLDRDYLMHEWPIPMSVDSALRLLAMGVSVNLPEDSARAWRFQLGVSAPLMNTPIIFSSVGSQAVQELTWLSHPSMVNRPVIGDWNIFFSGDATVVSDPKNPARLHRNEWPVLDIVLHLKLAHYKATIVQKPFALKVVTERLQAD